MAEHVEVVLEDFIKKIQCALCEPGSIRPIYYASLNRLPV